jgi:hypothetical protein
MSNEWQTVKKGGKHVHEQALHKHVEALHSYVHVEALHSHVHVHTPTPLWCNKTTKKTETPLTQLTPGWVYLRRAPTGGSIEYKYGPVLIKETYEALQREETRNGNVIFNRRLRQECERVERDWHALGDLSDYHDPRGKYEAYARSILGQGQGQCQGAESD